MKSWLKKLKQIKKFKLFLSILFTSLVIAPTFLITSCSNDYAVEPGEKDLVYDFILNKYQNPLQENDLSYHEVKYNNRNQDENLLQDALQKAEAKNNVLVYCINWFAVLHKYGSISHLLKVLEMNPEQEIYIINIYDNINEDLIKPILDNKEKYPHVTLKNMNTWKSAEYYWNNFEFWDIQNFVDDMKNQNKVIDFYFDDYSLLMPLNYYIDWYEKYINTPNSLTTLKTIDRKIFYSYKFLAQARSINLIADGTASWNFYESKIFNFLNDAKIGYDNETQSYPIINKIRNDLSNDKTDQIRNWLLHPQIKGVGGMILLSLISATNKDNEGIYQSKYFVPGTNTILDFNDFNEKEYESEMISAVMREAFWDPYFSVDASIIDLYKSFNDETRDLFTKIFNIVDSLSDITQNKLNVVYSGLLMENDSLYKSEAKIIYNLYKLNSNTNTQTQDDNETLELQVVYKAHPRQDQNYQNRLKQELKLIDSSFDADNILVFLNKDIAMEYYVLEWFSSEQANNSEFLYYSGFGTLVYFMNAANLDEKITKIIINETHFDWIKKWNGYPSRVFPKNKLTSLEQLSNLI